MNKLIDRRTFTLGALSLASAAGGLSLAPGEALGDTTSDALAEVKKARAGLKSLVGPFTQERTMGLLAATQKSDGEMIFVAPDTLRWELKTDGVVYFITPAGFAMKTQKGKTETNKAAAGRFGQVMGDMMTMMGGDLEKLRQRYDITAEKRDGVTIRATPKADDLKTVLKWLEVSTGPNLWGVSRIVIQEPGTKASKSGDKSVITFGAVQRDTKIDPAKL